MLPSVGCAYDAQGSFACASGATQLQGGAKEGFFAGATAPAAQAASHPVWARTQGHAAPKPERRAMRPGGVAEPSRKRCLEDVDCLTGLVCGKKGVCVRRSAQ